MTDYEEKVQTHERFRGVIQDKPIGWVPSETELSVPKNWCSPYHYDEGSIKVTRTATLTIDANWAMVVPQLITELATLAKEKQRRDIESNLLRFAILGLERRMQRLESLQTKIIPIDTFAPEPYNLLKTIRVSVNVAADEFEAGWYDANIHSGGDNEEEAVNNLKGQILDVFESYSSLPIAKLGPKPKKQLLVMQQFIQKRK